jgi:hypothetical protein
MALGLAAAACAKQNCNLGALLTQHAGDGARDCGHAPAESAEREPGALRDSGAADAAVHGDAGAVTGIAGVDACVTKAFTGGKPFFAEYDRPMVSSGAVFGIAGDGAGRIWIAILSGRPSSGVSGGALTEEACNEPSVDTSLDRDPNLEAPIKCRSTTPLGQYCGGTR